MIYGGPTIPAKNAAAHPIKTSVAKHAIAAQSAQFFIRTSVAVTPSDTAANSAPAGHTPDLRPAGAFPSQAREKS